jgi:DNA-binding response OmpR family regulator
LKLLIIEDDERIVAFLKRGLEEDGYIIDSALDGEEGEYLATMNYYDVIILDWMLPGKNGIEILKTLRKKEIKIPVLMLSAKDEISDKVAGLKNGADDYLAKPFAYDEFVARIEALQRRNVSQGINTIKIGDIIIDTDAKTLKIGGDLVSLTSKEYELLVFLIKHKNSMVSNSMIQDGLWSGEEYINSNVIQVTLYHLRKKITKDIIKSYRGLGYKIEI